MDDRLAQNLLQAAKIVEGQLDEKIAELNNQVGNLDDETELEELRRKRMAELRRRQREAENLVSLGHGKLEELADERHFFTATRESEKVVCHFYDPQNRKSEAVDKVLQQLAAKSCHLWTRFVKVNAEKVPFLVKRLNIRRFPTLGVCIHSRMVDFVRVCEEFGSADTDITIEAVEKRLADGGVVDVPPRSAAVVGKKTAIRGATMPSQCNRITKGASGSERKGDDWE